MIGTEKRCTVVAAGRSLEVRHIATGSKENPIVLLHEGLGSIAMWRDFPDSLALATGRDVFAYSRYGYGRSQRLDGSRNVDYMHDEARITLPAVLEALRIERPVLYGHSDGASIALIYAATFPNDLEALVLEAPHVFVESLTIQSIAKIKIDAARGDLIERLGQYHADSNATFYGWNDIWLHPDFRAWDITALVQSILKPILIFQGNDDQYGSVAQLDAIQRAVPQTEMVMLDACGHSPHRTKTHRVLETTVEFLKKMQQHA